MAGELAARNILWAPDFVVNAGGVIHGTIIDIDGGSWAEAHAAARGIGARLTDIYGRAAAAGITPHAAALEAARQRIAAGRR